MWLHKWIVFTSALLWTVFGAVVASAQISFAPAISIPSGGREPKAVVTGDFNLDGNMDFAVTNRADNTLAVFLGNGDGTFRDPALYVVSLGPSFPLSLAAADFNNDGFLDIVVGSAFQGDDRRNITVFLGNGDGTFQPGVSYDAQASAAFSMAVGDFDGDGNLDIAMGNNGAGRILLGNGDGSFRLGMWFQSGFTTLGVGAGDFNGDGFLDVVSLSTFDNKVSTFLGNGDGTLREPSSFTVFNQPVFVAVADLNRDGNLDLVLGTNVNNAVIVLLGNGDGTFQAPVLAFDGNLPFSVAVADFDGDGILDLAAASFGDNAVTVSAGRGDGRFLFQGQFPTDMAPVSVAVGDFNGDGAPDLVVANLHSDSISILLNQTAPK